MARDQLDKDIEWGLNSDDREVRRYYEKMQDSRACVRGYNKWVREERNRLGLDEEHRTTSRVETDSSGRKVRVTVEVIDD
ncbi:MAG TPA: hypothetical protein VI953_04410 [Candidatus Paceibacterota bacterium]